MPGWGVDGGGERNKGRGDSFSEIGSTDVAAMSALLEYGYSTSTWQPQKASSTSRNQTCPENTPSH